MSLTSPADPILVKKPFRLGFLSVWVILAAFALTLVISFYIVERIRGRAAWRAYEVDAKARGVKLDFADYLPPKIPDSENFASIPIFDAVFRASDTKEPIPNPFKLPEAKDGKLPKFNDPVKQERIDLAAWQRSFVEAKLLPAASDNAATDVLAGLNTFTAPLTQLREAGARPHCRFPVHWEKGFAAKLPHMEILQSASKLHALRLSAHLALGDSAAAYEDFREGLRVTTATTGEPSIIAGVVRISTAVVMLNAVWGGLADRQWAEPELRKIEADLSRFDWLKDYGFAMSSERGAMNGMADILIEDPAQLMALAALEKPDAGSNSGKWVLRLYPTGWLYRSKVRTNRYLDEMLARIDTNQRRHFGERPMPSSPANLPELPAKLYHMLFAIMAPVLENVEKRYVQIATVTDQARLGCALERFRLARGAFPQALAELTPDFLSAVPVEIVNGEPYRYRRTEDGSFLLYSVGLNLRDDGGVIAQKTSASKQADWVWRYPAK